MATNKIKNIIAPKNGAEMQRKGAVTPKAPKTAPVGKKRK